MRSPSLTRRSKIENGRLASPYEWGGGTVWVHDSAQNALAVRNLMRDGDVAPDEKALALVLLLFPDAGRVASMGPDELGGLVIHVMWEAFGFDISEDRRHSEGWEDPVFDFEQDAARIRASLLQCFGIDWDDAAGALPYPDLCALLGMLLEADTETPFQQAVYYRTAKPPKRDRSNKDLCDAFEARRSHFALDGAAEESANAHMEAMLAEMERAAREGA